MTPVAITAPDASSGMPTTRRGTASCAIVSPYALREPFDDGARAALRRPIALSRDAVAIARARRYIGKELCGQQAKGRSVHVKSGADRSSKAPFPPAPSPRRPWPPLSNLVPRAREALLGARRRGCSKHFRSIYQHS